MDHSRATLKQLGLQLLVCWILSFAFYYLADAAMDALLFEQESFFGELFHPSLHEIYIRLLSAFFQGLILVYAWRLLMARRLAEERLAEANRQLQQANSALKSFDYALAHDLRTPLTGLVTACALLREPPDPADPQMHQSLCLDSIESSCQRMERTISGLLKLADLGLHDMVRQPVDLSRLATTTLQDLRSSAPERAVEASITPGLNSEADPDLVAVLLDNLFGNAWKFGAGQPILKLTFASAIREDRQVFFLRDNGAGFDMQQAEHLFQPFARLHDSRQFPGQGIGLATARRIVDRHGGRIWAEAAPGQGATFYFTLQPD